MLSNIIIFVVLSNITIFLFMIYSIGSTFFLIQSIVKFKNYGHTIQIVKS